MTKAEALVFLELPATASEAAIKNRLSEKQAYFELLSEKAPSAFLRRVHLQHVEKIKNLQKEIQFWEEEEPEQPASIEQIVQNPEPGLLPAEEKPGSLEKQSLIELEESEPAAEPLKESSDSQEWKKQLFAEIPKQSPLEKPVVQEKKTSEPKETPGLISNKELPVTKMESKIPEPEEYPSNRMKKQLNEPSIAVEPTKAETPKLTESKIDLTEQKKPESKPGPGKEKDIAKEIKPAPAGNEMPGSIQLDDTSIFAPTIAWSNTQLRAKPVAEPVGWLVRHTEKQALKHFPIYPGKNFIGRKLQPGLKPFIQMEEDPFVSRVHAAIYVEGNGPYTFYVSDTASSNGGKPSKNGTYLNGSEDRVDSKLKLKDGDTLQIGVTKFVLRYALTDLQKMLEEVEDSSYMHTVVIDMRG